MNSGNEYLFWEIMDGFFDGPHATPSPSEEGAIFLGIKNIKPEGGVDLSEVRYISERDFPKWTKRVVPQKGDIVFSYEATLHRYALIPQGFRGCLGRRMALIRVNQEKVDPLYLYYYFLSPYWKAFINTVKISGATVDRVSIIDFPKYKINLPYLETQRKIVSIVSDYDNLIENNNRRITILEEMAEEIYKEWFVRLRFPGWKESKVADGVPEGWVSKSIGNVIDYYIGGGWGSEEKDSTFSDPAFVIRGTDMPKVNKGDVSSTVHRFHKKSNLKARKLQGGDIIFEVSGGTETQWLGRTVLITQEVIDRLEDKVMCASFCKLIRPNNEVNSLFLYHFFNRIYKTGEVSLFQVQSTGISNFQFEDFLKYQRILIPDEKILNLFEEITLPFQKEIQLLGEKNANLQKTRDLLLPRLVSGKLSVKHLVEAEEMR